MSNDRRYLYATVFVAGMSTLAIEFTASRMLQTAYGTSNIVWANVIGLVLLSLTAGYFIGGRLADRYPRRDLFYLIVTVSGVASVFFLLLTSSLLRQASAALAALNVGAVAGSLLLVIVALVVPVTLLGCLSPFAVRLAIDDVGEAGRISGRIYAISTLGSLLGTYLPVLLVIPLAGSRATALIFGSILVVVGLVGLWQARRRDAGGNRLVATTTIVSVLLVGGASLWLQGGVKEHPNQIAEEESPYNYIQVIRQNDCNFLLLNEGQAYHSFYCDGGRVPSVSVWSIMLAAPYFSPDPRIDNALVIGLAAGTIPKQLTAVFGPLPIDGIELDPEIVALAGEHFALTEPNIRPLIGDGRFEMNQLSGPYDLVTLDAYKVPYIPWHLTTQEFFAEVANVMSDNGVLAVNVGRTAEDRRLIEAVGNTLLTVFPSVHTIDVPQTLNTILIATKQETKPGTLARNRAALPVDAPPLLKAALDVAVENERPQAFAGPIFTDDRAPVEIISDSIVLRFLLGSGPEGLGSLLN